MCSTHSLSNKLHWDKHCHERSRYWGLVHAYWSSPNYLVKANIRIEITKVWAYRNACALAGNIERDQIKQKKIKWNRVEITEIHCVCLHWRYFCVGCDNVMMRLTVLWSDDHSYRPTGKAFSEGILQCLHSLLQAPLWWSRTKHVSIHPCEGCSVQDTVQS